MENLTYKLFTAITEENTGQIPHLLQKGALINFDIFAKATEEKKYDTLELFLDHGWISTQSLPQIARPRLPLRKHPYLCFLKLSDLPTRHRYTFDDIELARWFLERGADPNKRCRMREATPLSYAVFEAPLDVIDLFFQYGGSTEHGQLLHFASMRRDGMEILEYLISKDTRIMDRINCFLDEGYPEFVMNYRFGLCTPVQYAARAGSLETVKFLIEHGDDPWRLDPYQRNALDYAVYHQHKPVQEYLSSLRASTI